MKRKYGWRSALWPTLSVCLASAAQAADRPSFLSTLDLDVKGFIEARAGLTSSTESWEEGGLGKVRYGSPDGTAKGFARPEGALVVQPRFGFNWSGFVQLSANSQQRPAVDIVEAYLSYRTPPSSRLRLTLKAGAFFPPVSMENDGLAWTSPYTLSSSAINTWVGEELRTIGGEVTAIWRADWGELGLTGAAYGFNDPTGTLLAWRGWTISDREAGLFDRLRLPPVRIIRPGGILDEQAATEEPFHEIDDKVGVYAGAHGTHDASGRLEVLYYDNLADDRALRHGQWAWRTKFWSAGYTTPTWWNTTFIAQAMSGTTTVITLPAPRRAIVYTDFWSAYAMVSRTWGPHRLSLRLERFGTDDGDTFPDNNNEQGTGVTLAYIYRPSERQRITLEVLRVDSDRPERQYLGYPRAARETVLQASYRFFFGTTN